MSGIHSSVAHPRVLVALALSAWMISCGSSPGTVDLDAALDSPGSRSTAGDAKTADRKAPPPEEECSSDDDCGENEICNSDKKCEEAGELDGSVIDPGPEDSGTPPEDAGNPPEDSGQPPKDSGVQPSDAGDPADVPVVKDSGPVDTGGPKDTGPADTGPPPAAGQILPGEGLNLSQGGVKANLRLGVTAGEAGKLLGGDGATIAELNNTEFGRGYDALGVALLYLDSDGNDKFTAGDKLHLIVVRKSSNAVTKGNNGIGKPKTAFAGEFGPPEGSDKLGGATPIDIWFTKGLNITMEASGAVQSISVFKAQKLVPNAAIDHRGLRLDPPIGLQADVPEGDKFSKASGILGPPDVVSRKGDLITWSWPSLGVTLVNGQGKENINVIAVTRPYQGKLKGTALEIGSTRAQVEQALGRPAKSVTEGGQQLFLYKMKEKTIVVKKIVQYLAVYYNSDDLVSSYIVDYVEQ
ncbi:MAG: hypothetical protein GMKNLPBB_01020 [Myxococcota bacterium]|nr:hypothetical protein [Myxococcota bacterium]